MRALARLFSILIGMISVVGFGNTTDPNHNSNVTEAVCLNTDAEVLCVTELQNPLELVNVFESVTIKGDSLTIESNHIPDVGKMVKAYKLLEPTAANVNEQPDKIPEAPDLICDKLKLINLHNSTSNWLEGNRRAREGISCHNTKITIQK